MTLINLRRCSHISLLVHHFNIVLTSYVSYCAQFAIGTGVNHLFMGYIYIGAEERLLLRSQSTPPSSLSPKLTLTMAPIHNNMEEKFQIAVKIFGSGQETDRLDPKVSKVIAAGTITNIQ